MKRFNFFSFLKRQLSQEAGFSLAEVMVAAGMLGVLSLGVTQLMQNSNKTEKRLGQQVNMVQLESDVMDALRNQTACTRTFYGIDLQTNPLTGEGPLSNPPVAAWCAGCVGVPGDSAANGAAEPPDSPGWKALPSESLGGNVSRIFGSSRETAENNPNLWRTVLAEYDAGLGTGVYGNGSNTISIRDITYRGYFDDALEMVPANFTAPGSYSANGNGALDPIVGSVPQDSVGWVVVRVRYVRGRWAQLSTLADDAARAAQSAKTTTGQWQLVKYYPIRVRTRDAGTNIVRCLGGEEDWLSTICESMFDGYLDPADGRCKQTRFVRDSNSTGAQHVDEWGMVAANDQVAKFPNGGGGNALIEDSLLIGGDLEDNGLGVDPGDADPGPGLGAGTRGNLVVRNNITGYNMLVIGDPAGVEPLGTGGPPAFGPIAGTGNANIGRDLHVFGNSHIRGNEEVDGWLDVGNPGFPVAPVAGDGSFGNDLYVLRNTRVDNVLTVGMALPGVSSAGDAFINNDLKVNQSQAIGAGANLPSVNGASVIEVRQTIGQANVDTGNSFAVYGGANYFERGSRQVRINSDAGSAFSISNGAQEKMTVDVNGYSEYYRGSSVRITINENVGSYNAIRIINQPLNDFGFNMASSVAWEVPTKAWVKRFVYGGLYENNPGRINDIINNMANYVNHRPWDQVRSSICTGTRLSTAGQFAACTYSAGVCTCRNSNCSSRDLQLNGANNICSNMRLTGYFRATGTGAYIYTSGYMQSGSYVRAGSYVQAGTNVIAGGNVSAGNQVTAGGIIRGASIYTNAVANPGAGDIRGVDIYATSDVWVTGRVRADNRVSASRICEYAGHGNNAYCYTKFGRLRCSNAGFMIGIAYGHPICARSGGGSSGGQRF